MIERCARALCEAHGYDPDALAISGAPQRGPHGSVVVAGRTVPLWHFYAQDVQLVLEAARAAGFRKNEPIVTEAMQKAGAEVLYGFDANTAARTADERYWATQVFRAMWSARPKPP